MYEVIAVVIVLGVIFIIVFNYNVKEENTDEDNDYKIVIDDSKEEIDYYENASPRQV